MPRTVEKLTIKSGFYPTYNNLMHKNFNCTKTINHCVGVKTFKHSKLKIRECLNVKN